MKPIITILRVEENFDYGTFGTLLFHSEAFCSTLEPPDLLNAKNISSIPAQQYLCRRTISPKYGGVFEVQNVPRRSRILFHAGNVVEHTEGCIIVAQHFGKLRGDRAVLNSGKTFNEFMNRLNGYNEFLLTIKEVY